MKTDRFLINPSQKISLNGTKFPLEYLYRGLLVTGAPGSGKTRCILLPLLDQILRQGGTDAKTKPGLMIIDPKNELLEEVRRLISNLGRSEDLQVLRPGDLVYNPLDNPFLSQTECVEKLISFASNRNRNVFQRPRGDELFWANAMRGLIHTTLKLNLLLMNGSKSTFKSLNSTLASIDRCKDIGEVKNWLRKQNVEAAPSLIRELSDYFALPIGSTRPCVSTSAFNVLSFWGHEPLNTLVNPSPSIPSLDPMDIIHSGKIVVVACSSAAYGASISPFLLALKEHLFTALLSRDQIEVEDNGAWKPINQTRPVFILADEFQAYLSPDSSVGELVALDRLRGFKAGMIAATQNIASIQSVLGDESHSTRLVSLFSNQIFMSNICPHTAQQAANILGSSNKHDHLPPPLLPALRDNNYETEAPFDKGNAAYQLGQLKTGEYWARLADGKIGKRKASLLFKSS